MNNCIFCKIIQGKVSSEFVYESDTVVAFNDVNPIAPVHVLIIPKKHIESMNDIDTDNNMVIADMFAVAVEIAKQKSIDSDGYKLLIRTGKNGGQEVPHIHLHLIGGALLHEDIHPVI
jgi:histidine triad (HIT) family protein